MLLKWFCSRHEVSQTVIFGSKGNPADTIRLKTQGAMELTWKEKP